MQPRNPLAWPQARVRWAFRIRCAIQQYFLIAAGFAGFLTAAGPVGFLMNLSDADGLARWLHSLVLSTALGAVGAIGARNLVQPYKIRLAIWLEDHPQDQAGIRAGYVMPEKPLYDEPYIIWGEAHPTATVNKAGEIEAIPQVAARYSATPHWVESHGAGLLTGNLILGSTGTGKTSYFLKPAVFRLFHHPSKIGGLVMDAKASLVQPLTDEMRAAGREADLLPIGPDSPTTWNPLHAPNDPPSAIAERLLAARENLMGSRYKGETQWIRDGAVQVAAGAIGILRLAAGYVTAAALLEFYAALQSTIQGSDTPSADAQNWIEALFVDVPYGNREYEHALQLLTSACGQEERYRSIFFSECSALLRVLVEPAVYDKYNPPLADLDMLDWRTIIDEGRVVVLNANSYAVPGLAVVIGTFLKLGFQYAMLARPTWARQGECNGDRYMTLIVDEWQEFVSITDAKYLALSRESKAINVFATQSFEAVKASVSEDDARVILQNMRTKLILAQVDATFAADLIGQADIEQVDANVTENTQGAALASSGRFAGDTTVAQSYSVRKAREHVVKPELIAELPTGQAFISLFDGERQRKVQRVYGMRTDLPIGTRYVDLHPGV